LKIKAFFFFFLSWRRTQKRTIVDEGLTEFQKKQAACSNET
jgi:hypothetical protein